MLCHMTYLLLKRQFRHLEGQVTSLEIQAAFCARTYTAKSLLINNLDLHNGRLHRQFRSSISKRQQR